MTKRGDRSVVDSEGRANAEIRIETGTETQGEAGGNASGAGCWWRCKRTGKPQSGSFLLKSRPSLTARRRVEGRGREMVGRVNWGTGERSYKREDAGGRGEGWLRKGFGFKRSPAPDPDPTTTTTRTDAAGWACGLVGLWAVGWLAGWTLDLQLGPVLAPLHCRALHAGSLRTSGTLETERGHWPPVGFLVNGTPGEGVCVLGPGLCRAPARGAAGGRRRWEEPPRVTGLQGSRSAQARLKIC